MTTAASAPSPDSPGALNWALLTFLGVVWGSAFMGQSIALQGFEPVTMAALRCLIATAALLPVAILMGQGPRPTLDRGGPRGLLFAALIGAGATAVPFLLLAWGLQHVPSAFAGVAMGAVPLLILPLVAVFSPEEGIGPRRIMGVILGFFGLVALIGPPAFAVADSPLGLWGRLACLGAAMSYAVGSVLTRRAPAMPPVGFAALTMVAAAALLTPAALLREGWPQTWSLGPTIAIVMTGLLPTGLAAAIRIRIITTAGSLFMSLVSYMVPLWSVIFGIALLGEDPGPGLFTGLALILGGIALSQSRAMAAAIRRR
ncbi:MAG: DMT family transporter [Pseudomonadota bacterium]